MVLKTAGEEEIQCLSELRVAMLNEEQPYSMEFNKKLFDNTKEFAKKEFHNETLRVAVAAEKGIVSMGWINFFCILPNDWCPSGRTAYIGNVYTIPKYRKRGFAKQIIAELVEETN